jgi:hypothetical protein
MAFACGDPATTFCICDSAGGGALTCSEFFGFTCDWPCETTVGCGSGYACVDSTCCAGPVCVPTCGNSQFFTTADEAPPPPR